MHLIQTRKKLLFVFITIGEHCSDDTISKNSKCLETIEFENALQGGPSIHTWNLLVFSGMPVPLCILKLQIYQTTGRFVFVSPHSIGPTEQ